MKPARWLSLCFLVAGLALMPCGRAAELPPSFSEGTSPDSPWMHRDSGFYFRAKVADFTRGEAIQYNPQGTDVSVGYNFYHPRVVATFYVYPAEGRTLEQEFQRRQTEVTAMYPAAKLVTTDTVEASPKKMPVKRALYAIPKMFKGVDEPMQSVLLVGQLGKERFVEYRISYPVSGGAAAEEAARRFVADFPWP